MSNTYASGKFAIAECDRCGQRYKLKELKNEIIKTRLFSIKVCPDCWDPDQPQLSLGMYPVSDPQAIKEPRPDTSYITSGTNGLQITGTNSTAIDALGYQEDGSRIFQWGWNPIGGSRAGDAGLTPNYLVLNLVLGNVTISTT
jgi:hypothetical protein